MRGWSRRSPVTPFPPRNKENVETAKMNRPLQDWSTSYVSLKKALTAAIIRPASRYGRYGYRRFTAMLRAAGWHVDHMRVERIRRREGCQEVAEAGKAVPNYRK